MNAQESAAELYNYNSDKHFIFTLMNGFYEIAKELKALLYGGFSLGLTWVLLIRGAL